MKKLFLGLIILSLLVLSACSLQDYIPNTSDLPVIVLNDSFNLNVTGLNSSNSSNASVVIDVNNSEVVDNGSDVNAKNNSSSSEDLSDYLTVLKVTEGEVVSLQSLTAEDPDGDSIVYTYSQPFDANGLWVTKDGDEGTYLATITASDGVLSTTETVKIIVLPSNKAPIITCPSNITVKEGDLIKLDCSIVDLEGDNVSYKVSGFMDSLTYETTFDDAGEHDVIISATDGNKNSLALIKVYVENVNRAPTFVPVKPIEVTEGDSVVLDLQVSDPDGDSLTIDYPFVFDNNGVWMTKHGDAGNYDLEVSVSDGKNIVKIPVNVVVNKLNIAPVIDNFEDLTVEEGDLISLSPSIVDADDDSLTIIYSGFMNSTTYQTTFDDAGVYNETLTVSDGQHTVSKTISITILNKNRPPVFVVN